MITGALYAMALILAVAGLLVGELRVLFLILALAAALASAVVKSMFWRCPKCGELLPKGGIPDRCPKCGEILEP